MGAWQLLSMDLSIAKNRPAALTLRVVVALVGGYAFTWGFVTFGIASLAALGRDFHEAEMLLLLLAFIVYLGLFLWAFTASSLMRVVVVFAGGGLGLTVGAWALQRAILG